MRFYLYATCAMVALDYVVGHGAGLFAQHLLSTALEVLP